MAEFDAGDVRLENPEADRLMAATPELWRYLPKLLVYPLRGYALFIVVIMGAALWVAGYAGVFGLAALSIFFGWMGYYAMGVVERTATGHAVPPPLGTEVLFQGEKLRLGLLVLYPAAVLLMALAATRPGHSGWGVWIFVAGVYLFPAFLTSLALQPDLLAALNPLTALGFVWHTGLAYLFACLALAGVGFLAVLASGHVAGIVTSMLMIYSLLFVCHLIGYVAYHRNEELGIAVTVQRPSAEAEAAVAQAQRLAALLAAVDRQLEARNPRAARDAILAEKAADVANPRGFHEELFEALRKRHQDALSLVQGARLIQFLAEQKRLPRALDICEQCLDVSKDFLPPPALVGPLAEQALKDKRLALFNRLGETAARRDPQGEGMACIQFLKAQALVGQKQDGAALALLTPLLSRASHPWAPRIAALHKALQGLQKKA